MKTVKKLLLILLVLCTVFSTAACNLAVPAPAETSGQASTDKVTTADKDTDAETDRKPTVTDKTTTEEKNEQTTVTGGTNADTDRETTGDKDEPAPPTEEVGGEVTKEPDAPKPPVTDETTNIPVVTDPPKTEETTDIPVVTDPPKDTTEETTDIPVVTDPPKDTTEEDIPENPPVPGCSHEWQNGFCSACGTTCLHEHATDSECMDCGMQFVRPTLYNVAIYKDRELAHSLTVGEVSEYMTLGYVIEYVGEKIGIPLPLFTVFSITVGRHPMTIRSTVTTMVA